MKGFEQIYGQDYDQTFAGIVKASILKVLWALTVTQDWEIEQMDTISAFTQGEIEDPVYIEIPPGYWELIPDKSFTLLLLKTLVCLLYKALYNLKQSAIL